ncbi:TetR/AcrR family transcriptional repressor of mexJK operon [Azospirillum agricola]|uniref:TetR/AcrR family transcriptional regulator n=1 Tax=Azospirillum agricola TaxID=1720247 RepID=UPI002D7E185B|nr:TetR/AcrR family transcriptional regulator [Azospirillum agricola]MBP2228930.1 TetR/AcrR family transcriptional repressor of mexJK operon [Azospirillum agricola]
MQPPANALTPPSPSVSKPDDFKPDAKAEQILAASREIILEMGYAALSMDLVAQRARVSKTTLYTRFPSKEELFSATITAECDRRGMRFQPDEFDELPLRDILLLIGRRFVDLLWSDAAIRVHQSVLGEAARQPEIARLFFQAGPEKGMAAFVALFEHLAERGLIRTGDPSFVALQFMAAMQGGPYCALVMGQCPLPPEEERGAFVAKVVDLFLRGIAPSS